MSFGSKVRPKTLGCNAMGSALLFMFRPRLLLSRAYLRGGGSGGSNPPEIFRFFLKSEGKEVERKRKK